MSTHNLSNTPARKRSGMNDAIVVVYKSSQSKVKSSHPSSTTSQTDYWIVMLLSIVLPIVVFVLLYEWVARYHQEDDYELGPGVNKHPMFMGTAFGVIMPYAMLVFRIFRRCPYNVLILAHGALQSLIALLGSIGFIYAIKSHTGSNIPTIPHFYSLHSLVGLCALSLFLFQIGFGLFCAFIYIHDGELYKAVHLHRIFGIMTYILAFWTIMTGLTQIPYYLFYWLYHERIAEAVLVNSLGVATAVTFSVILFGTARRKYQLQKGEAELDSDRVFKCRCFESCFKRKESKESKESKTPMKRQKTVKPRCTCKS